MPSSGRAAPLEAFVAALLACSSCISFMDIFFDDAAGVVVVVDEDEDEEEREGGVEEIERKETARIVCRAACLAAYMVWLIV